MIHSLFILIVRTDEERLNGLSILVHGRRSMLSKVVGSNLLCHNKSFNYPLFEDSASKGAECVYSVSFHSLHFSSLWISFFLHSCLLLKMHCTVLLLWRMVSHVCRNKAVGIFII